MNTETLDRLEAALANTGRLPLSSEWMHWAIRHSVRNMDFEDDCADIQGGNAHMPDRLAGGGYATLINALPALLAIARRAADVEGMASIIARCAHEPRFGGRRSLDKSCGEVYEITDRDCIPADGFPVVETIPLPNFSGERAAQERAEELSLSYTATAVSRYVMGETTPVSIADIGDDEEVGR